MVEEIRDPSGGPPEGERRKTAVIREGIPRQEVLSAMSETSAPSYEKVEKAVARATILEGIAGTCSAVLAVIALLGTYSLTLTAIGVIVLGGAILFSAGGISAIVSRLRSRFRFGQILAEGADAEALAGAAVIAGGILVLANVAPAVLLPVAVIVLGGCFLLSSGGLQFFVAGPAEESGTSKGVAGMAASSVEILVGLAAAVLGVLALAGLNTPLLSEIAVLSLGIGGLAKCMTISACGTPRLTGW